MNLADITNQLRLEVCTGGEHLDREVTKGYVSDMLSDVMGNAVEGSIWVTIQKHHNIIAVAVMKSLAAIVLAQGRTPDPDTVTKAEEEGVVILTSSQSAFDVVGRLNDLGITGE